MAAADEAGAQGPAGTAPDGPPTQLRLSPLRLPGQVVRAFRLVWEAARPELTACIAVQVLSGVGVALQLLLGRNVLAAVVADEGGELRDVLPDLVGLAVVTAALGFGAALLRERQRILSELVERHVHGQIIDVVADVDLEAFESASFHDRLRRAKVHATDRSWQAVFGLLNLLSGLAGLAGLAVVLVAVEPVVLPLVLVAGLPLWLATIRNGRATYDLAVEMTAADRERTYLQEALTGRVEAKELRLFSLTAFLRRRYDDLYARRIGELRRVARLRMRRSLLANAGATVVTLLGVGLLVQLALTGRLAPADAGVAAVAVQQLGTRLRGLDASAGSLHECSLFLDDLVTFLDLRVAAAADRPTGAGPLSFSRLSVDGVGFVYPGTTDPVLRDVSLEIGDGEVVALVGRNGSGKTTLAKILCGLYAPTTGRVLWDGVDAATCDPAQLRKGVTAIFQDFVHYELTARDNVAVGDSDRADDLEGIRRAARLAGADDLLAGLPAGYQTRLSRSYEGGADLSIGQWQRVALARAFFRDAPLLVLDEPTAALDAEAEHQLFEGIRSLQQGRAVLLISHRFSSVRSADRIHVLEGGRLVETGSHEDLVRRGGPYAEMFALQASAYVDDAGSRAATSARRRGPGVV
jgi:ATP-binding cassette subfamily B protein